MYLWLVSSSVSPVKETVTARQEGKRRCSTAIRPGHADYSINPGIPELMQHQTVYVCVCVLSNHYIRNNNVRRIHLQLLQHLLPSETHLPVVSNQALAQAQLPENVHHDLHGGVVSDGEGAHVQDGAKLEGSRAVGRQRGCMLGEVHP